MKTIGVYGGSFDPITKGHIDVIKKGLKIFDKIIVVIAKNPGKNPLFTPEERTGLIIASAHEARLEKQIEVDILEDGKLLAKYTQKRGAVALIRSMRTATDFEQEFTLAFHNKKQAPKVETVFIKADDKYGNVSSSAVREIFRYKGKISYMVFPCVRKALKAKHK